MNITKLSIANILNRKFNSGLNILLVALSTGLISLFMQINDNIQQQFYTNLHGIDMVVGAKGSPLQLVLSVVFHIDTPTGNISLQEAERIKSNRLVKTGIPLSLGDNYRGFRIVGTDEQYPELFGASLVSGRLWQKSFEVTIGQNVARTLGLKLGDLFVGVHGLEGEGHLHEDKPYEVVGIFDQNNSVLDQLILTPTESIWDVHHEHAASEAESHHHNEDREITAMLIQFLNPLGMVQLPRYVNENTQMQSAVPSFEIDRLLNFMGIGIDLLVALGFIIMVVAGLSIFISLFSSLKNRKHEMALMRLYGASQIKLLKMVVIEGTLLAVFGAILGLLLSRIAFSFVSNAVKEAYRYDFAMVRIMPEEYALFFMAIFIAFIASLLPAINAFRISIPNTLSHG
jgi:putative ABC transport system permease protein